MKKFLASLLAACLTLSLAVLPSSALEAEEVRRFLQQYYVDEIPPEVLELGTLEEILAALDDPYTVYMTAEEYQQFLTDVNGDTVVGIGVSVQTAFEDGYQIMSVLPDSPALEAGLEPGDRIVAVDGVTLTAGMDIRAAIAGQEGTHVTVTVASQASGERRDFDLERREVAIPIVTYDVQGSAGVIDCSSFGESTGGTVRKALEELNDQVAVWIMDLRSNPGGTDQSAAAAAGFFAGGGIMVYFRGTDGSYHYTAVSSDCPDLTDKPLMILTSPYSASGAELFAAAARDLGFGVAIGQRTFGKGVAQSVFYEGNTRDDLFHGDALKVTTYRFFSPDGTTNHIVGILPTLLVSVENTPAVALLLSSPEPPSPRGYLKLELSGHTFYLDIEQARTQENAAAFTELLSALPPFAVLYEGGQEEWTRVTPAAVAAKCRLLGYEKRSFSDVSGSPFRQEIETLAAYRLVSGYEDGTFRPGQTITRAEFCAMIASALDLPAGGALGFSDTGEGEWYTGAVSAMTARGFASGYEDGTFRPDSPITYEEMVTVLAAVAAWANMDGYALEAETLTSDEWLTYHEFSQWAQLPARNLDRLGALVPGQAPGEAGTREMAAALLCELMEGIHLIWD